MAKLIVYKKAPNQFSRVPISQRKIKVIVSFFNWATLSPVITLSPVKSISTILLVLTVPAKTANIQYCVQNYTQSLAMTHGYWL